MTKLTVMQTLNDPHDT